MKKLLIWMIVALITGAGCISKKPATPSFYLLEYPANRQIATPDYDKPLPVIVEIAELEINPAFASFDIALRHNTREIKYFSNHRWAIRPSQSLNSFLMTFFERNNVFENTGARFWRVNPHYRLRTIIHQLEVLEENRAFYARLHIEITLIKTDTEQTALTHISDRTLALEQRDLNLFADAISNMFFEELELFSQKALIQLQPE